MLLVIIVFVVVVFVFQLPACSDGSYGLNCMSPCGKCSQGDVCDKINGTCPGGCQPGFDSSDPFCQKSKQQCNYPHHHYHHHHHHHYHQHHYHHHNAILLLLVVGLTAAAASSKMNKCINVLNNCVLLFLYFYFFILYCRVVDNGRMTIIFVS